MVSKGQVIRPLPSRFNTDLVVQSESQLLFAAKVSFRRVDGHVAEQELDLIELAACQMAETRTRTSHAQSNPSISRESLTSVGDPECAGMNRHVVGNERVLQERRKRLHLGLESCGGHREVLVEA